MAWICEEVVRVGLLHFQYPDHSRKMEERVEEMDDTPSWKELAEAVTTTAEEICGRQPRSSDIPCLESMKPEILRIRKCVEDRNFKVQECRGRR